MQTDVVDRPKTDVVDKMWYVIWGGGGGYLWKQKC